MNKAESSFQQERGAGAGSPGPSGRFREYKVVSVYESGLGTFFLGAAAIPVKKMEMVLNREATEGWQVVFQVVEQRRFLLFWKRETIIITLGR
jgi:hypothetical protein